ncbi:hypothetical protein N7G274_004414 [Stereocaulon virgatum]|uniref:F-box domain-containing protein n=1 Tax=Stereocaulon virgatum TaxID=373712 RepID=A0ABR4AAZ3_9LECA
MANETPPEVLELICQHLETPDLKTARFICQSFNAVAQKHLFKDILVRSNLGSFRKLSCVSRHPILKQLVDQVSYDGGVLKHDMDYDEWLDAGIGIIGINDARMPVYANAIKQFQAQLLPAELEFHYSQYRYYLKSEHRVFDGLNLTEWLGCACASFPNLEALQLLPDIVGFRIPPDAEDYLPSSVTVHPRSPQMSWDILSPIGREALSEPKTAASAWQRDKIFHALLDVAYACRIRIRCLKGDRIPWKSFRRFELESDTFDGVISRLRQLELNIACNSNKWHFGQEPHYYCAHFIGKSMMLHTLHLSFHTPRKQTEIRLSQLIKFRDHWPSLHDLKLGFISSEQSILQTLLITHAPTLRSLELSNIRLDPLKGDGTPDPSSWGSMLQFLRTSLQLKNVQFDGMLDACKETWITHDDEYYKARHIALVKSPEEVTLRDRIENFVLKGGSCPLPGVNNDRSTFNGDYSWCHGPLGAFV